MNFSLFGKKSPRTNQACEPAGPVYRSSNKEPLRSRRAHASDAGDTAIGAGYRDDRLIDPRVIGELLSFISLNPVTHFLTLKRYERAIEIGKKETELANTIKEHALAKNALKNLDLILAHDDLRYHNQLVAERQEAALASLEYQAKQANLRADTAEAEQREKKARGEEHHEFNDPMKQQAQKIDQEMELDRLKRQYRQRKAQDRLSDDSAALDQIDGIVARRFEEIVCEHIDFEELENAQIASVNDLVTFISTQDLPDSIKETLEQKIKNLAAAAEAAKRDILNE